MNRDHFGGPFSKNSLPAWHCPTCGDGVLALEPNSLRKEETRDSKNARSHDAWEPDWIHSRFDAVLRCGSPNCRDVVMLLGHTEWFEYYDEEHGQNIEEALMPTYFEPPVMPIQIPRECPEAVRNSVSVAAQLLWTNPPAAGNALRTALEALLSHKKILQRGKDRKGKSFSLKLHARIELFQKKEPRIGEILLAIKWLGNVGSHSNELSKKDVLDGFELLEHALEEMFLQRTVKLTRLTKQIIKRKGPTPVKRGKRRR